LSDIGRRQKYRPIKLSIQKYLSVIDHLSLEIKDMEKIIKQTVKETKQMASLKTIPGVGEVFLERSGAKYG